MLGLLGLTSAGAALAPALRVLTWPLLGLTVALIGWGWGRRIRHGHASDWSRRSDWLLVGSTLLAAVLWLYRWVAMGGAT